MKTLSIIALAGLATVASANPALTRNANYAGHNSAANRSNYGSAVYVLAVDGDHWDISGDSSNTVLSLDLNALLGGVSGSDAFVTGLGWDTTINAFGASWMSESAYNFAEQIFLSPGAGSDFPGTASFSSGGIIDLGDDAGLPDILAAGGILTIELFESFDDVADAIDSHQFGTLTLAVDYKVPTPAGLAVLGLGGLAAARRRR
jgi:hypothetical protein